MSWRVRTECSWNKENYKLLWSVNKCTAWAPQKDESTLSHVWMISYLGCCEAANPLPEKAIVHAVVLQRLWSNVHVCLCNYARPEFFQGVLEYANGMILSLKCQFYRLRQTILKWHELSVMYGIPNCTLKKVWFSSRSSFFSVSL